MNNLLVALGLGVFFTAIFVAIQSLALALQARKEREQREILRRLNMSGEAMQESLFRERSRDSAAAALGGIGVRLQSVIDAADSSQTVSGLLLQVAGLAIAGLVLGSIKSILLGVLLAILGALIPYFYLVREGKVRLRMLTEQLPEALDLMARSLQAGLGLNEAFRTCAEEMPLPLAGEFGRVFEEVRLGRDYRDAFANLLRRNPGSFDLRLFASSVLLQRDTGGNLIEILDSIANTIRGRFVFQAKVRALTSEARFSALILGSLPFVVGSFLGFFNPGYLMPLINHYLGNVLLIFAIILYSLGAYMMYSISQVEV